MRYENASLTKKTGSKTELSLSSMWGWHCASPYSVVCSVRHVLLLPPKIIPGYCGL